MAPGGFRFKRLLTSFLAVLSLQHAILVVNAAGNQKLVPSVCQEIASKISSESAVFFPGNSSYTSDLAHWASSSTQESMCSVEPGNAGDVGAILRILGRTRTPFAVKSGGHATNVGFSSTTGVAISMKRFSQVVYDSASGSATIGTGQYWDDVYAALLPFGVNVLGGRVPGIGVGGFALGGGYAWRSNELGLAVDSITQIELVKPNGVVVNVTHASDPELFFGLKGGFNNFGIVTKITLKAHPQGEVWGGTIVYGPDQIEAVKSAVAQFVANVTDTKANIIASFTATSGIMVASLFFFYDGSTPATGVFDTFLSIPNLVKNVDSRTFPELITAMDAGQNGNRAVFHTAPISDYPESLLDAIINEANAFIPLTATNGTSLSYSIEPFMSGLYTHSTLESAYPPNSVRKAHLLPLSLSNSWPEGRTDLDSSFQDAITKSSKDILNAAIQNGVGGNIGYYPNYAIFGTSLESMYGENLGRLRALKKRVDPTCVMGLAGGWKF